MKLKQKLFDLLESDNGRGSKASIVIDIFIIFLIFLTIVSTIVESYGVFYNKHSKEFFYLESIITIIFTIEYFLRIYISKIKYQKSSFSSAIKFIFSFHGIIDILAIIPYYLSLIFAVDIRFLRILRLLRVFKFTRYFSVFKYVLDCIKKDIRALSVSFFMAILFMIIFSVIIYNLENPKQPENFPDIPSTMWWGIITMTTIGYGDIYPVTPLGKIFASIYAVFSIFLLAVPTAILTSSFINEIKDKNKN